MARSRGTITAEDQEFVETWENISLSSHAIIRIDARGDEKQEVIQGPRRFMVTTEERLIHQAKVANPKNDPYLNGCFRPIIVPPTVSTTTNPNAINDEEIASILRSSDMAWDEWMSVLTSPQTLQRMVEQAEKVDDISLKRYKQLKERLAEVKPKTRVTQKDARQYEAIQTGGRSSDYR